MRIVLLLLAWLAASPSHAETASFVSEVNMDITAANAADARAEAMAKAEAEGLSSLLEKLAPDQKERILKGLDPQRLAAMVKGTEVLNEKLSGNRYRATLRISYAADAVNKLIDRKITAVGAEEDSRTSILVVPLFKPDDNQLLLWEENNPWRVVWSRVVMETASGEVVVPYADSLDMQSLTARNAMSATYSAYLPLVRRYGVRNVAVLQANVKDEGKTLEVVKRLTDRTHNEVTLLTYRADPQEGVDTLFVRAARDIAVQLRALREETLAVQAEQKQRQATGRQMVLARFATLHEWIRLRERLKGVAAIERIDILAMSASQVDTQLVYQGTAQALEQALAQAGLPPQKADNYWVVEGRK